MRLQLTMIYTDDVLNIGNASFMDLPGDIVPLEAILQSALLDQEGDFHGGEDARRREILDPWQQIAGGHLVDTPLVEGLAMDDLFFIQFDSGYHYTLSSNAEHADDLTDACGRQAWFSIPGDCGWAILLTNNETYGLCLSQTNSRFLQRLQQPSMSSAKGRVKNIPL